MSTEYLFSDDAWTLNVDHPMSLAESVESPFASPYTVITSVDYTLGTAYTGVFVATTPVGGSSSFQALCVDTMGAIHFVTGTLTTIVNILTVDTILGTGATFPVKFAVRGAAPNATWWYTTAPDVMDSFIGPTGFTVGRVGVITFCPPEMMDSCQSRHSSIRVLNQALSGYPTVVSFGLDLTQDPLVDEISTLSQFVEPVTHALIGAMLGDLEVDVGKSVPWTSYFTNNVYITDINLGDPRYWIIDWDRTFAAAKHTSLPIDFFSDPIAFRKAQFAAALEDWKYQDQDWVLFIDGHEGLSCDTRSLPDHVDVAPFASYIQREVQRAVDLGDTWVSIPFYAFVRNAAPEPQSWLIEDPAVIAQRVAAAGLDIDPVQLNTAVVYVGVPYYYQRATVDVQGLVRLVKVSALKDPTFDWALIDTLNTPTPNVKLQVVSYGYARWVNPDTGVDEGYQMRRHLNKVRPLLGLPITGSDATGTAGPYSYASNGVLVTNSGSGSSQPILTPMYSASFRDNFRDGVWYDFGDFGSRQATITPLTAVGTGVGFNKT